MDMRVDIAAVPEVVRAQFNEPQFSVCCAQSEEKVGSKGKKATTSPLMQLVQAQEVDGSWSLPTLHSILRDLQCPESIRAQYSQEAEKVWATICAVLVLRLKYAGEEGEWRLLVGKARRWLKTKGIADVSQFEELVAGLIIA